MKARIVLSMVVLFGAAALTAPAEDKKAPPKAGADLPAFEKFKNLAGEWSGKAVEGEHVGMEVHIHYKVSAGGSAVIETIGPNSDHEMVTVIHPDGDSLILTHYCMLGNQPQMKADGKADGDTVAFKFTKATNLKSDKDMYMHDAAFTFVDKDTIKTTWTLYNDGKPAGKSVFELKRKK
jgi:hypothetical protein